MVDIHSHVLFGVDDGCETLEESIQMLKTEYEMGVTDVFCTPHLRGSYNATEKEVTDVFNIVKKELEKQNIPINLYMGREVYVTKDYKKLIVENDYLRYNKGRYVLVELPFHSGVEASEIAYELKTKGFLPIFAHLERYDYVDIEEAYEIKNVGGYIQVNASSVVSDKNVYYKFVKKLFKEGLVDFVASDIHKHRTNEMDKAYKFIAKKFGEEVAEFVFVTSGKEIIKG